MSNDTPELPPDEWVSIEEAQRITGLSRAALMMRKSRRQIEAKVVPALISFEGQKVYFKRSQLPKRK